MAFDDRVYTPSLFQGTVRKNATEQIIHFYMYDNNGAITGAAANIDLSYSLDGGAVATTVGGQSTPYEVDATDFPGWYEVRPTQAETNGDVILLQARKDSGMGSPPYPQEAMAIIHTEEDYETKLMGAGFSVTDSLAGLRDAMVNALLPVQRDD